VAISRVSCWWLSFLLSFAGSTDTLSAALQALARAYFNDRGLLKSSRLQNFGKLMDGLRKADDQAVTYGDVLNYVDRANEIAEGRETEKKPLAQHGRGRDRSLACSRLLCSPNYQVRGAIFAVCRGRVILADDMVLGKTVQALAATELLGRSRGIQRVLIVSPASVKYQWKNEIESSPAWTRRL
jgi:SNF2 family DNA or RNA helicase